MFNLRLCNAATIRYSQLKFGHMYLSGMDYKYFSPHCCKCNSFGRTVAIKCGNACHRPHSDSLYSGSEHSQFNSPRLVEREAGFPNPWRALIGSNQLWRVNDSPYYREYNRLHSTPCPLAVFTKIIGHVGHFRWLGPNVWWEISQIWIEYIKPIRHMFDDCDEPWKFFGYTALGVGVGGAVRFLLVGTIGQEERPPRGQLWMEQCLTSVKYWPI